MTLLEVQDLCVHYTVGRKHIRAVDGLSFSLHEGETLGLIGESGCGKSTTGRAILLLETLTRGKLLFQGKDMTQVSAHDRFAFRRQAQMVFQDPYSALDPRMTAGDIIAEPLDIHHLESGEAREARITELLQCVGMHAQHRHAFPHEFSGGQRQRIGIARALAVRPRLLVCDEPISALDVSVQAQILNLLKELQRKMGMTYLFITHDLRVARYVSTHIAIMYLGHIVEYAPTDTIYKEPRHPYTRALLASVPSLNPARGQSHTLPVLHDEGSHASAPSHGCIFAARCPFATEVCRAQRPPLIERANGHHVACHIKDL